MKDELQHIYNRIPIPDELDAVVSDALCTHAAPRRTAKKIAVRVLASAASFFLAFVLLLNTSSVFASTCMNIPVISSISRVFTFREYAYMDQKKNINVRIPNIDNTGKTEWERQVNQEIEKRIHAMVAEFEMHANEYYNAYISTGGRPEEFHPVDITVDYSIEHLDSGLISFIITGYESSVFYYQQQICYNINLTTGSSLTLKDVLGPDYVSIAVDSITRTIDALDDDEKLYFFEDVSIADLIDENRNFYIDQEGNIIVIFQKYEIAAGAAGVLEYTVGQIAPTDIPESQS